MQLDTNMHSDNEAGGVWHVQLNIRLVVCKCNYKYLHRYGSTVCAGTFVSGVSV